jgi:hypothetical protein
LRLCRLHDPDNNVRVGMFQREARLWLYRAIAAVHS